MKSSSETCCWRALRRPGGGGDAGGGGGGGGGTPRAAALGALGPRGAVVALSRAGAPGAEEPPELAAHGGNLGPGLGGGAGLGWGPPPPVLLLARRRFSARLGASPCAALPLRGLAPSV